jgi:hypothetical protein
MKLLLGRETNMDVPIIPKASWLLYAIITLSLGICLPSPGQARIVMDPSDAAFTGSVAVPLNETLPASVTVGTRNFTITQSDVQFDFSTLAGAGLFQCAGLPRTPPCSVTTVDGSIMVTVTPPVPALGFVFIGSEIVGTITFTGTAGSETFTTPMGARNLFIGAADIGDIMSVTLDGLFAQWGALRFVPPEAEGPVNVPPVASAGADRTLMLIAAAITIDVTLDGSGSTDADGTIVEYQWSTTSAGTPDPADGPTPTVTVPLGVGTHTFRLVVVDDDGASSAPDEVIITVLAALPPNVPPLANAGPDQTLSLPAAATTVEVILNGQGSTDADGTIQAFQWSGLPDPDNVATPMVTLGPGTHTFTLVVTDNAGASSAPDDVIITVLGINLITPQDGDVVTGNAVAVGAAIASMLAVDGVRFQFHPAGTMAAFVDIGADASTPFVVPWDTTGLADGAYELQAIGTLETQEEIASARITVTVNNTNPAVTSTITENIADNGILRKRQMVQADVTTDILTSDGATITIPAGALATDMTLTVERRDVALAPGRLPGEACGPLTVLATAATFATPFGLAIPYPDIDQDGLIDGTGFDERHLTLWFFVSASGWVPLSEATVDPEANVIRATFNLPLPKQFAVCQVTEPVIDKGAENPVDVTVTGSGSGLPALQVRIATGFEAVDVTQATVTFTSRDGSATDVSQMHVTMVDDANGNGQFDADETVLGSQSRSGFIDTLTFALAAPLQIAAASQTHLLVLLDINAPASTRATGKRDALWQRTTPPFSSRLAWLVVLPGALGVFFLPRLRHARRGGALCLLLFVLCSSGALSSCFLWDDDDTDVDLELPDIPEVPPPPPATPTPFTFDVDIRTDAILVRGVTSAQQFTGPDANILGASVEVTP